MLSGCYIKPLSEAFHSLGTQEISKDISPSLQESEPINFNSGNTQSQLAVGHFHSIFNVNEEDAKLLILCSAPHRIWRDRRQNSEQTTVQQLFALNNIESLNENYIQPE